VQPIDIDVSSVDIGTPEFTSQVTGKDWFHVVNFPRAGFVSTSIKPGANGSYAVTGTVSALRPRTATHRSALLTQK
jgi:polyisoprenoid-binding protein YceI